MQLACNIMGPSFILTCNSHIGYDFFTSRRPFCLAREQPLQSERGASCLHGILPLCKRTSPRERLPGNDLHVVRLDLWLSAPRSARSAFFSVFSAMWNGSVVAIFTAPNKGAPMQHRAQVRAVPGRGLEGDRYFLGAGAFSRWPGPRREVTLIAEEALREMTRETGVQCPPEETRRNLLTRGVPLSELVGQTFAAGPVRLRGVRRCLPCGYLEGLTGREGLRKALEGRGGLRAQILTEGHLRPGASVRSAEASQSGVSYV